MSPKLFCENTMQLYGIFYHSKHIIFSWNSWEISKANLLGVGIGFPNISQVLVEHGRRTISNHQSFYRELAGKALGRLDSVKINQSLLVMKAWNVSNYSWRRWSWWSWAVKRKRMSWKMWVLCTQYQNQSQIVIFSQIPMELCDQLTPSLFSGLTAMWGDTKLFLSFLIKLRCSLL